jgi:thioredoxin 1
MFVLPVIAGILTSLAYGENDTTPKLPRLVDLGASKCIPCKKMKPILDELREEYRGRMDVIFIVVWQNPKEAQAYGIESIPTQIFYDAEGKELFRHEGFFAREEILAKWNELGVDLSPKKAPTSASSSAEQTCFMCDEANSEKTLVEVKTPTQPIRFCSIHCYFIYRTSLKDAKGVDEKVSVTDWETGSTIPAVKAVYLVGLDDKARSTIKAFATKESALKERQRSGGNLMDWLTLSSKEQAMRCGFCDRAVYAEDSCLVKVGGLNTYGCCPMCALGVAVRLQKNIEVKAFDALTGEPIHVTVTDGRVSDLNPKTAIAWAGQKKDAQGKTISAGCFKQAFFVNEANLKTWLGKNPSAVGTKITIDEALQAKMNMTAEQIRNACKIDGCEKKK